MTVAFAPRTPPLLACAETFEEALDEVTDAEPTFLRTGEKAELLRRLTAIEARVGELRLRVMASAGDVADATGARDIGAWLAAETRQGHETPRADHRLATALDRRYEHLRHALRAGAVNVAQARVIAAALDGLPDDLDPSVLRRAEEALVGYAASHTPRELTILGRRILEVVAPEIAEAEEARRLQAEEAHARARAKLTLKPLGDGTTRLSGVIPNASADRLATYLHAFTNPRKPDGTSAEAFTGSYPRRLGQAFCQLLESIDPGRLPQHGGDATTVMVTIPLAQLRAELGVGELIGGDQLSASEIRRLACTAHLIPPVLGGRGEVLDLGRTRRLFSAAQRKALRLRDKRCRAEGCTIPGTWCEAHHWRSWADGGPTDLADGGLLCGHHHHRAHDPAYTTERLPNGDVRFHRRR